MILPDGVEHIYAVDCPACDAAKEDDAELSQHLAAVSRFDAGVEVIAEALAAKAAKTKLGFDLL